MTGEPLDVWHGASGRDWRRPTATRTRSWPNAHVAMERARDVEALPHSSSLSTHAARDRTVEAYRAAAAVYGQARADTRTIEDGAGSGEPIDASDQTGYGQANW